MARRVNRDRLLLAVTALVLFTAGLGLREPWPADEPRFALIAREMVETGEWLIPHRAGEIYAEKPPLFFWLIAALYTLTGSLRVSFLLPSALAGAGVLLLVHDLASRLWRRRTALLASLALLCCIQFVLQARTAQIDAVLLLWTTLGLYGIARHILRGPSPGWWYGAFAAAGAGVITKGVGFLPLLALIPARIRSQVRPFSAKQVLLGLLVTLGVIALWLVPMVIHVERSGSAELGAYRDNILLRQTAERYARAWHHHKWFGYFFFEVIPWAWFPLTTLLPWTIPAWIRRVRRGDRRLIFLLGWVALVLLFFTLSSGKRGVYVLPALPAFVLAHTPLLPGLIRKRGVQRTARVAAAFMALLFAAAAAAVVAMPGKIEDEGLVIEAIPLVAAGLGAIALAAATASIMPGRRIIPMFWTALAMIWLCAGWIVMPNLDDDRSSSSFMADVTGHLRPGEELGILAWREQFVLQAGRPVTTFGYGRSDMEREGRDGAAWLVARPGRALMVTSKQLQCFDSRRLIELPRNARRDWYLARAEAVHPQCRPSP
jgi:4-amino-4-deoxy-L-arabinose transferase-like glycosyltransferase